MATYHAWYWSVFYYRTRELLSREWIYNNFLDSECQDAVDRYLLAYFPQIAVGKCHRASSVLFGVN